eukprot:CAMPEP_0183364972 /NCGR_PEP_ID=MMETSP0164_2-20130417/82794_1 /TAXON_ID=221442 /ORGANISM="Coccolithus pelagicus ssp braarudi, Strain PLY182g" /LENGTH=74 /DNA_ID=CAMNT_0025540395 /DNA_START=42 /DNA_END=262 /DNA_ORIENTATION=+
MSGCGDSSAPSGEAWIAEMNAELAQFDALTSAPAVSLLWRDRDTAAQFTPPQWEAGAADATSSRWQESLEVELA